MFLVENKERPLPTCQHKRCPALSRILEIKNRYANITISVTFILFVMQNQKCEGCLVAPPFIRIHCLNNEHNRPYTRLPCR
ncbi:Uncharacterized protein APZ42_025341 [Daphnia magna]|uniref:Uncharacterized protein n=1 Tax=Daphnia magna TaxID=35525 RepID=A0A0P5Z4H1_9CRUS|nr:Uncharacterized protein APZ42_025341 [Daphnia magna]